ncbi:MAG: DUF4350 domain-containing protein [Candidatus Thermoplasmatota archaeon]
MKRMLWLGILFLSASWLFFIPQFTLPDLMAGTLCVVLGAACTILGIWHMVQKQLDVRYTVLLIPVLLALLIVPFPFNPGLVVLAFGLLAMLLSSQHGRFQAIPFGLLLSGFLLLLQTMVFPFSVSFVSHGHRLDFLSPVVSVLANLFGFSTSASNGLLFVQTLQQTYPVTITWEKLGFSLLLSLFLGALVLFVLFYEKRTILKHLIIFLVAAVPYLLLRFLVVLALYGNTRDLSIFWDPLVTLLSFLPFALLLMKLLPFTGLPGRRLQIPALSLHKKHLAALLLVFLLVFSLTGAFLFQDPGSMKQGRVLIDEYHSQWEDTRRPLDTDWYGLLSTYNYYSWAQWLQYHYPVQINNDRPLTESLLGTCDVLILKCPTESYTASEIDAITAFVKKGGGLYLIGDHTNVFGMNTFLNQLAEQFGIRFRTDATYELGTGNLSVYETDPLFSHPVMRHVPRFEFMTSCTLEPTSVSASLRMENIIIGNRLISEPGTYATENFFRESLSSPDAEFGYLLQAAAIRHGAGRVVAFTDSTVFSSFCVFTDGYPSFTLGVIDYLNRTNTVFSLNLVLFILSLLLGVSLVVILRPVPKPILLWMVLFSGLLAFCIAAPLSSYQTDLSYPLPLPQIDYTRVCFELQHSSMNVSLKPTSSLGTDPSNFGTFYVWTQRLGVVPSLEPTLLEATENGQIIVLINPTRAFTEQDIQLLTTFFERGGRLLVLDSIRNPSSTANELLGNYGVWITTTTKDSPLSQNASQNESDNERPMPVGMMTTPHLTITGGTPLLTNTDQDVAVSLSEFENTTTGKTGRLLVVVDSYTFCDAIMGSTFTVPTERQRLVYDTEFFLFTQLLFP